MEKEEISRYQRMIQRRIVVWVVLTIVLQVITVLLNWHFLQYVVWLATAYCVVLIILWCYFE